MITTLLEQTNQTQNSLIASINEILSYQKDLQDLNNTEDREKMDLMMQSMQQTIQSNQDNFATHAGARTTGSSRPAREVRTKY